MVTTRQLSVNQEYLLERFNVFAATDSPTYIVARNSLTGEFSAHPYGIYFPNSDIGDLPLVGWFFKALHIRFPIFNPVKFSGFKFRTGNIVYTFQVGDPEPESPDELTYADGSTGFAVISLGYRFYLDNQEHRATKRLIGEPAGNRMTNLVKFYREAEHRRPDGVIEKDSEAVGLLRGRVEEVVRGITSRMNYLDAQQQLGPTLRVYLKLVNKGAYTRPHSITKNPDDTTVDIPFDMISEDEYGKVVDKSGYEFRAGASDELYLEAIENETTAIPYLTRTSQQSVNRQFALRQEGAGLRELAEGQRALVQVRMETYKAAGLTPADIREIERFNALRGQGGDERGQGGGGNVFFGEVRER
ncbi:MAG: hypothetical protein HYT70_00555 [Candidatus Aenigmarchaeota archaeon]|nr:hypothetical protein [Candidatus Aenigmarchaeota archaeon]